MRIRFYFILLFILPLLAIGQNQKLRVGVIPYKTAQKVQDTYTPLFEYVADKLGRDLELTIVSETDLGYALDQGEFDLGIFPIFPYLRAKADFDYLEVFASHQVNYNEHYSGAILTLKSSNINAITDLKGRKLGFVKPTSTSGYHLPKSIIEEYDVVIQEDQVTFTGGHHLAIESLINGDVEAIGIDLSGFSKVDYPISDFKILSEFDIPYHAYVFSPKMNSEVTNEVAAVMFRAQKDPAAREIFSDNPLKVTSWVPKNESYYNSLRRYLREVRIKPHVSVKLDVKENTQSILAKSGDILPLLQNDIEQEIKASGRFDLKDNDPLHTLAINVSLFAVEDKFHYQVQVGDHQAGKGDISLQAVKTALPKIAVQHLLADQVVETELLKKETAWFATYGFDDGINLEHYRFAWVQASGEETEIPVSKITLSAKNLLIRDIEAQKGDLIRIHYIPVEIQDDGSEVDSSLSYDIFSAKFWNKDYWDKLGLILGVLFALISALVGRFYAKRKQIRFKNILYGTNELVKDFIQDHLKFETKVIEQKEEISRLFENGTINENQFMILNKRIEEVSVLMDRVTPHDVQLTASQKEEIEDIVVDGQVTEKEFSRIMTILNRS